MCPSRPPMVESFCWPAIQPRTGAPSRALAAHASRQPPPKISTVQTPWQTSFSADLWGRPKAHQLLSLARASNPRSSASLGVAYSRSDARSSVRDASRRRVPFTRRTWPRGRLLAGMFHVEQPGAPGKPRGSIELRKVSCRKGMISPKLIKLSLRIRAPRHVGSRPHDAHKAGGHSLRTFPRKRASYRQREITGLTTTAPDPTR
jgi:hypothetical protein